MDVVVSGVGVESVEYHQDSATVRTWFGQEKTPPSTAVVATLAELMDADPVELEPLYSTLDPDALDALVRVRTGTVGDIQVSFTHEEHAITVYSYSVVAVTPGRGSLEEHTRNAGRGVRGAPAHVESGAERRAEDTPRQGLRERDRRGRRIRVPERSRTPRLGRDRYRSREERACGVTDCAPESVAGNRLERVLVAQQRRVLRALLRDGSRPADPILREAEPLDHEERLTVCYELHHVLLPELADAGLVTFDRAADEVRPGPRFDEARRFLERGDDARDD